MAGTLVALLLGTVPLGALAANEPYVVLVDSEKRQALLDSMADALKQSGSYKVRTLPQRSGWVEEAMDLALQQPDLVVAHFHALQSGKTSDRAAQEKLLRGMFKIQQQSPNTRFLIWSANFDEIGAEKAQAQIRAAALRVTKADQLPDSAYDPLRSRIQVMVLPQRLRAGAAMGGFTAAVTQALAKR